MHAERAVQMMAQLDALTGPAPVLRARRQLQRGPFEAHGVVGSNDARVLEAAHRLGAPARGQRAPGRAWLSRRDLKAGVVPRQIAQEEAVGGRDRGDARKAQLGGEAVLQCAEEPLDAALGLRRVGEDHLDPQLSEGASELRRLALAGELLLAALTLAAVDPEDPVAVAVHPQRAAPAPPGPTPEAEGSRRGFLPA